MIIDPEAVWHGPFPYQALAEAGVTARTTQADLRDEVPFIMMARGPANPDQQRAWDELNDPARRLLIDLLLYPVDPAAESAAEHAELDRQLAEPGMPAALADALTPRLPDPVEVTEELGEPDLPEPQEIADYAEFHELLPPAVLDRFITFDR